MSKRAAITFNPARVAQRFSTVQPAQDPVQSARAATAACCLQTTLRVSTAAPERRWELTIPARNAGVPVLQMLATSGAEGRAALVIRAAGPSECPPGQPNQVQVQEGVSTALRKQIPFERWTLPVETTLDFSALARDPAALLTTVHPFRLRSLAPAVCLISVPGCSAVALQATIAVFPDVRWEGKVQARVEMDAASETGFRIVWESGVNCSFGSSQWRPQNWNEVQAWCPWFGLLDPLARSLAAITALRHESRAHGLDNRRLCKAAELEWSGPKLDATIESSLFESEETALLGHRLEFLCIAEPLLSGCGEMSLLAHWLENPLWLERLAPLLIGVAGRHVTEVAQELGVWLVADGQLRLNIGRHENRPKSPARSTGDARGAISLKLEGRSIRDYETIVVRAGSAKRMSESAGFAIACVVPPESAAAGDDEDRFRARVAFSGVAVWSLEKLRPGIRIRRLSVAGRPTNDGPSPSPSPLAVLLSPRVWPPEAIEEPAAVPWHTA